MPEKRSIRMAYGETLVKLGAADGSVVVLDADLSSATMTNIFKKAYPDRFYNFGIAEANMVCAATGMALSGLKPFVSTFAIFGAGRAYEMIRNSVAHSHANVKLAFTHSGLSVGEDGGTHQSIEDIALMRILPGMTVFVPCDAIEAAKAVAAAANIEGPVYLRLARPVCDVITKDEDPFIPGRANVIKDGKNAAIFASGLMVSQALEAARLLGDRGIDAAVINFHTLKPFDSELALEYAQKCGAIVTAEDHSVYGGLGSATAEALMGKTNAKFRAVGIQDRFGQSGSPGDLFREYGLTAENIAGQVKAMLEA